MTREQRERMTETYAAVSDALRRSPVPTYGIVMERAPNLPRPPYLPEIEPQTTSQYLAVLGKLSGLGMVKVN